MIYLNKNVGFWQFGDILFLNVYVPLLFATIVDVHMYKEGRMLDSQAMKYCVCTDVLKAMKYNFIVSVLRNLPSGSSFT